jgi:hypothetical protein
MNRSSTNKPRPERNRTRLVVIGLLVVVLAVWFLRSNEGEAKEYRLYLSEDRPAISLRYDELSGSWTEQTLRERFPKLSIRCYADSSHGLGDRVCAMDVLSNNGVPTMFISFFFAKGQLAAAAFNIPWWAHGDALDHITASFGEPHSAQLLPRNGVRLYGWELPDHGAIFYNRDRSFNPLQWNSVFWNSAAFCARSGCFKS